MKSFWMRWGCALVAAWGILMMMSSYGYATPNTVTGNIQVVHLSTKRPVIDTTGSCKTVRVIDGDTVLCGKTRVRAADYDTAEVLAKCADPSEQAAIRKMAVNQGDYLATLISLPHKFGLKFLKGHDEFGRALAKFYRDGQPIAPMMISYGAHPYSHATGRTRWCN